MNTRTRALPTGVELEYVLAGPEGADVLCFVHGASANLRQFSGQLARFDDRYRVLLVSLRGHGGSSRPATPELADFTCAALAADLMALWDALDLGPVHLVGNSLGGLVGYELLQLAPGRLRTLTTFGTTAQLTSPASLVWTMTTLQRLLGPRGMGWLFSRTASRDREVAARVGDMCRTADKQALLLVTANIARYDYTPLLGRQTLPILLLRGAFDADINQNLRSTLAALEQTPRFRLVELPGAGHFANLERPDAFDAALADFLTTAEASREV